MPRGGKGLIKTEGEEKRGIEEDKLVYRDILRWVSFSHQASS